jgi:hypothetical protein
MPKKVTTKTGKNAGRKFLVYDPAIPGDLPKNWLAPYEEQKAAHAAATALTDKFIAMVQAEMKKGGNTDDLVVMLNFNKISITLDDGQGRRSAVPVVKPDQVNWANVGAALKAD